jgi:hypothetical protein
MEEDPKRVANIQPCGIYVRAKRGEKWEAIDIAHLTTQSVKTWMTGRSSEYLQNTILLLLGHEVR